MVHHDNVLMNLLKLITQLMTGVMAVFTRLCRLIQPALVKTEQLRFSLFFLLSTTGMWSFMRKSCFLEASRPGKELFFCQDSNETSIRILLNHIHLETFCELTAHSHDQSRHSGELSTFSQKHSHRIIEYHQIIAFGCDLPSRMLLQQLPQKSQSILLDFSHW